MSPRRLVTMLFAALLGGAVLAGCGSTSTGATQIPRPGGNIGTPMSGKLPAEILNMRFTDSTGRPVRIADFAGRTVVITDTLALCQEACPIDTATYVQTMHRLEAASPAAAKKVVFLTITVDPERDTPALMAAYRKAYVGGAGQLPQWRLLTGDPADVHALWKYFGVYWKKVPQDGVVRNWLTGQRLTYDVEHSDEVFFIDGQGRERFILDGIPALTGHDTIPSRVKAFMDAEGHTNAQRAESPNYDGWTSSDALSVLSWLLQTKLT